MPDERNPMVATTYGVGEIVAHAVRRGYRNFIVGLGGSGTSDAGMGMLKALVDTFARSGTIDDVVAGALRDCRFTLATDVENPLYGDNGAACVYGSQKGATPEMVCRMDHRARKFARLSALHLGRDCSMNAGAGAAGGLGYAFMQFFHADCRNGAELLMSLTDFGAKVAGADCVVTGEGRADRQTLMGKLPWRVMRCASTLGKSVWLVAGQLSDEYALTGAGFSQMAATTPQGMRLEDAMRPDVARENIKDAVRRLVLGSI